MADYWKTKVFKAPKPISDTYTYKADPTKYQGKVVTPTSGVVTVSSIGETYAGGDNIFVVPAGHDFYATALHIIISDQMPNVLRANIYIGTNQNAVFFVTSSTGYLSNSRFNNVTVNWSDPFPHFFAGDALKVFQNAGTGANFNWGAHGTIWGFIAPQVQPIH